MVPRELIALLAATLTTLSVATAAVASPAASIDGGGADAALVHGSFDYDATQEIAEDDDNEDAANASSSSSDSNAAGNYIFRMYVIG